MMEKRKYQVKNAEIREKVQKDIEADRWVFHKGKIVCYHCPAKRRRVLIQKILIGENP
jgi:hypothetical protein